MAQAIDFYNNTYRKARRRVVALTADYSFTADDSGTLFTNRGAAALVTITLPAVQSWMTGLEVEFFAADNDGIRLSGTAGELMTFNDAAANSVAISTSGDVIGGSLVATCDGTSWLVRAHLYDSGVAGAQTVTIVT